MSKYVCEKRIRIIIYKIKNIIYLLRLALYPTTTILCCLLTAVIFNVIFACFMCRLEFGSNLYNVFFALVTGATASFIVSIIVELSNNYKSNRLACYELDEYYHTIINFERSKNVANKFKSDFEEDKIQDIVQLVWRELPKMSSVLFSTLENKKAFLSDDEIKVLLNIKSEYDGIKSEVCDLIKLPHLYNTMNHPDEDYLSNKYPKNILKDTPEWLVKYLATKESEEAVKNLTDIVISDDFLLKQLMSDYNISIQGMSDYTNELDDGSTENIQEEVLHCDDIYIDFENLTEENYKTWLNKIDEDLKNERKQFVSWYISNSCYRIAQNICQLEKYMSLRPYVGIFLEIMAMSNKKLPNR